MPIAALLPNRIYPLGASSSPDPVFVTRVAGGTVYFHDLEYKAVEQRMVEPIFRSLCSTAMKTGLNSIAAWERSDMLPLPDHLKRDREVFTAFLLAGENTMPELNPADYAPKTYEPMRVRVSVADPSAFDKTKGRSGNPYYVAESYGSILVPNGHPQHYIVHMARRDVPLIAADTRFKIESVAPEFFKSYVSREEAQTMDLEKFKAKSFQATHDQAPDDIAVFYGMPVAEYLLKSQEEQRRLWEGAFGAIAFEEWKTYGPLFAASGALPVDTAPVKKR